LYILVKKYFYGRKEKILVGATALREYLKKLFVAQPHPQPLSYREGSNSGLNPLLCRRGAEGEVKRFHDKFFIIT
jgi:hypothetical protein